MKFKVGTIIKNGGFIAASLAIFLTLVIESLGRFSILKGLGFLWSEPTIFFYNAFLIFTTLSLALLVRRRIFFFFLISCLWLALGITNGAVLSFRMTPFTVSDLAMLENGISILPNYLSNGQIFLVVLGTAAVAILFVLGFLFAPKHKEAIKYKTNILLVIITMISFYGITSIGIHEKWLTTYFSNLGYAYHDYGVPYCFMNTWLNRGVPLPQNYNEAAVLAVFPEGIPMGISNANQRLPVDLTVEGRPKETPNIVFVQLESFIDPLKIRELVLSEDPIPNFHRLQKEGSTGYLLVPAVGAGTANTEFEVLTGMRIKSFGPGEYPYKTIMKKTTCETISYVLKDIGYSSHAIHNHRGEFYGRNQVFSKLGFDTFTSVEYMNNINLTPKKWEKDKILTGEILTCLDSTEGPDFVFTVSVQGHGKYPEDIVIPESEQKIAVVESPEDEAIRNAVSYYIQQIYEMDLFVGELTKAIDKRKEKTIVVFYGDHLPVLDLEATDLETLSLYKTEYVVYANFDLLKINQDLFAYQLSSQVLERLGIHSGILPWFHQTRRNTGDYVEELEMLQYDMLYGQNYIYGGKNPFSATSLQMGVREIRVDRIFNFGDNTYVVGENFTPFSMLAVNGDLEDTIFIHPKLLKIEKHISTLDPNDYSISQVGKYNTILSTLEDVE